MLEMPKKFGVIDFVSEIERVENNPDFKTLDGAIHHGQSWSNFVQVALLRK